MLFKYFTLTCNLLMSRPHPMTFILCRTSPTVIAEPMPEEAPVTKAMRPTHLSMSIYECVMQL